MNKEILKIAANYVENINVENYENQLGLNKLFSHIMREPIKGEDKEKYAQYFTPVDVAIYSSQELLNKIEGDDFTIFDPCVGMGSLLIASAYVIMSKYNYKGQRLIEKLKGSEISEDTRVLAIENIVDGLEDYLEDLSKERAKEILKKNIVLGDFLDIEIPRNCYLIANPPYKEDKKAKVKNIWLAFGEKITKDENILGFSLIVPVSICSADRTSKIREQIKKQYKEIKAFHHEIRPRPLFLKVEQRITILTCLKSGEKKYKTTGFVTHRAKERSKIWEESYVEIDIEDIKEVLPKICKDDLDFYKKQSRVSDKKINEIKESEELELWVRTTGRYKLACQYDEPKEISSKWKKVKGSKEELDKIYSSFQNGQALKWWKMFGDGRDISLSKFLKGFKH